MPPSSEWGTFKESRSAPIHRWFSFPAGFSYRAVEWAIGASPGAPPTRILDPFAGSGTVSVVAKGRGIPSGGTEAHPLVARIARTKVRWDYDMDALRAASEEFLASLEETGPGLAEEYPVEALPELVRKCFSRENLGRLLHVRETLRRRGRTEYRDLFELALLAALRDASAAATGWPYIAPRHRIRESDGLEAFRRRLRQFVDDLVATPAQVRRIPADVREGDCRSSPFEEGSFDLAFTSPPYLNNYDYADRTRLESYFLGFASSWREISERVRQRLVVSATTQVERGDRLPRDLLSPEVERADPRVARGLRERIEELSRRRLHKGGRKSYDLMVALYFNDMTRALAETARLLRPGSRFLLILGDSAPYGVHVPTEVYLGRLARGLGFRQSSLWPLRRRGEKWRSNPQRHRVALRESLLVLRN